MLRPLPPQNPRMFPFRAAIERKVVNPGGRPTTDLSGARKDLYTAREPEVPCNVIGVTLDMVPHLGTIDNQVATVVTFPDDVKLKIGDVLHVVNEDGDPWPKPLTVQRYQRLGIWCLRRWQADCKGA